MLLIHLSRETEALAEELAALRGISREEAVKVALEETSKENKRHWPTKLGGDELTKKMEEISARSGARPLVDPRSPDELMGYDDHGLARMIVIDSSALIAILEHEPDRERFFLAIGDVDRRVISAVNYQETGQIVF